MVSVDSRRHRTKWPIAAIKVKSKELSVTEFMTFIIYDRRKRHYNNK